MCVHCTVHNCCTQYCTEQTCLIVFFLTPPQCLFVRSRCSMMTVMQTTLPGSQGTVSKILVKLQRGRPPRNAARHCYCKRICLVWQSTCCPCLSNSSLTVLRFASAVPLIHSGTKTLFHAMLRRLGDASTTLMRAPCTFLD